ncbi:hypothetical protein SASPL_140842 [Salvia splendens]|uniref:Late embryogenesis abundant protein LEA-2 subgroup domain-containing protein n=1 Tax=Salvia splendens TaxID=180675 RepID=A0A8X8WRF2_SALSN|nr:uncharacterized protein LOC121766745 [Salvia splendens]KAG6399364.1 hypothetical protein SASPL_140842 [Salvia splendens]
MSEKKEQVKPLAPAAHRVDIDDYDRSNAFPDELGPLLCRRRQRFIKLCGCSSAILLIAFTVVLVLMFTVLHVKIPSLKVNPVTVEGVAELNGTLGFGPGRNLTFGFGLEVKNPNVAPYRFGNVATFLYYGGSLVGQAEGPAGEARARKRVRVDVRVVVMVDKIREVERLKGDLSVGILSISSYMKVSGKVKITQAIKKNLVIAKLNCTMNLIVRTQGIQDLNCH